MFECDTLFPVIGLFPVTWQTRDMGIPVKTFKNSAALYTAIMQFVQGKSAAGRQPTVLADA